MSEQSPKPVQLALRMRLEPAASFDNFEAGDNEQALAALRRMLVVRAPAGAAHSSLGDFAQLWSVYLCGVSGTGKTHLLEAACRSATQDGLRCAYVVLSRPGLTATALIGLGDMDLVCLDDLHCAVGHPDWESALFVLYNELEAHGRRLAVASRQPPGALPWTLPDLASRLQAALVVRLKGLDDAGRRAALQAHARARGLSVGEDAADYILARIRQDMFSLMNVLDCLDEAAMAAQRRLSVPFVREVLTAEGIA